MRSLNTIKLIKFFFVLFLVFFLIFFSNKPINASEYVMPYPPSFMPGNKFYRIRQITEMILEYLYFGNLAHYKYYRNLSDKYLIQAKTLFEYKQYQLALNSLEKSDEAFNKAGLSLFDARKEKKNISEQLKQINEEYSKHLEILDLLLKSQPEKITWLEEKKSEKTLEIKHLLNVAKKTRYNLLTLLK